MMNTIGYVNSKNHVYLLLIKSKSTMYKGADHKLTSQWAHVGLRVAGSHVNPTIWGDAGSIVSPGAAVAGLGPEGGAEITLSPWALGLNAAATAAIRGDNYKCSF